MTVFEHLMVGASLAFATGLHHRYGWRIAGLAAVAGALPDWDGLSILFGAEAYAKAHRAWGHNLLVASIMGAVTGGTEYQLNLSRQVWRTAARLLPSRIPSPPKSPLEPRWSAGSSAIWATTGMLASLSHLLVDLVYSGHATLMTWPLQLLWPFSTQGWAFPIVPWGDLGATFVFIGEMFALYRRPSWAQRIAWTALLLVVLYVGIRWQLGGIPH